MTTNLFERASRQAFRFASNRGELTTEQLWALPLTSKSGFDLDSVAKLVNAALKADTEESFVKQSSWMSEQCSAKLDVVKHIIAFKIAERDAASVAVERAAKRAKLLEILERKQDSALEAMTAEEIAAQLADLER